LYAFFSGDSPASEVYMPRFRTLCLFHLHRQVDMKNTYPRMKMEQTECSEMLAYKLQTPVNHPERSIQHSEHCKSLKSFWTSLLLHGIDLSDMTSESLQMCRSVLPVRVFSLFMYLFQLTLRCQPQCNVGTFISSCPASLNALCVPECV
jgi:hypothetical protein